MVEMLRIQSFNYQCPEIIAAPLAPPDVEMENPFGHFSVLVTDIPGYQPQLDQWELPPILFDNLNIAPEEALPQEVNPYLLHGKFVLNPLPYLNGPQSLDDPWPSEEWLRSFTIGALSDSMRTNTLHPYPTLVQEVFDRFRSIVDCQPEKHVLVIDGHGGLNPLVAGDKYRTVMPATEMLASLTDNLQQFFPDMQTLSDRYSCILFTPCDSEYYVFPDELAEKVGIPVFYIAGKSSGGESYPIWLGDE